MQFFQLDHSTTANLGLEAQQGLLSEPAALPPKFFYDTLGSRLFDAITELDEYYPTRTEAAIFTQHGPEICQAATALLGAHPALVDLGAGNCAKAARLFEWLQPSQYVAVDISAQYLQGALTELQRGWPTLPLAGVGQDFSSQLRLPEGLVREPALVFYPGSSIGNFNPEQACRLLQQARQCSADGALLIGVDLVKPHDVLQAAYDDALGVTAAFNLNILRHLNRLLGADFDLRQWAHVGLFNAQLSRIEMHLQAREALQVRWAGHSRHFAAGERIHTENSYKWAPDDFDALLKEAGCSNSQWWFDEQRWFGVCLAR